MLPGLVRFARTRVGRDVELIALSIDELPRQLRRHLRTLPSLPFTPYWVRRRPRGALHSSLAQVDIPLERRFSIPTLALLDRSGRLVRRWKGFPGEPTIRTAVQGLAPKGRRSRKDRRGTPAPQRGQRDGLLKPRMVDGVEIL